MKTQFIGTQTSPQMQVDAYFELVDDNGQKRLHSVAIFPSDDPDKRLIDLNNSLVNDLKFPAVTPADWKVVADECKEKHTLAVKQNFAIWQAEIKKQV